jgi:hypothetical protein
MTFCESLKNNCYRQNYVQQTKELTVCPDILTEITVKYGGSNDPNSVIEGINDTTKFSTFCAVTTRQTIWSPSFTERTVNGVVEGIPHAGFGRRVSSL